MLEKDFFPSINYNESAEKSDVKNVVFYIFNYFLSNGNCSLNLVSILEYIRILIAK